MGSRDAYALNIVSLERAPASSTVWTSWTPWRRDADAAPLRSVCEPHVLAVEANAHSNWINDIVFSHDDLDLLRYAPPRSSLYAVVSISHIILAHSPKLTFPKVHQKTVVW